MKFSCLRADSDQWSAWYLSGLVTMDSVWCVSIMSRPLLSLSSAIPAVMLQHFVDVNSQRMEQVKLKVLTVECWMESVGNSRQMMAGVIRVSLVRPSAEWAQWRAAAQATPGHWPLAGAECGQRWSWELDEDFIIMRTLLHSDNL